MGRVVVVDHPLAQAVLTTLRDKNTKQIEFRKGLVRLGRLMGYEIVKSMDIETVEVETPLGVKAKGVRIRDLDHIVIIQVLRAAMPLVEGLVKIFANARMGVVSARRVEESHRPGSLDFDVEITYVKVPRIFEDDILIVADPMLATGSTITSVLKHVFKYGNPKRTIIVSVIATKYGIERVLREYPFAEIYTVSIDPEINEKGYIVPGLGDAGDRAFGGP
ncbi:uracil phosphoribosyltransferase [Vulcanisaeta sp. JCM 16161]|uniref:uracil phosphoribosyltransferase n=1 Tax=Vulcanisaeta sp. JCM 16161 TaxID=1295372 RepID=UPI0006D28847|nr:uracil phosphoribosyltransferase [Vulcanisaeta sp. JCM 16161]